MSHAEYKVFPTELHMLQFFGQYLPKLDVMTSARMAPFMYVYDGELYVRRGLFPMLEDMEEYSNLGIDTQASTHRGTHYIIFFNKAIRAPEPIETLHQEEVKKEDIDSVFSGLEIKPGVTEEVIEAETPLENELVTQAKALYNDADKKGSKLALEAFGNEHGISLNKGKTFEGMVEDLITALDQKDGE